MIFSLLLTYLKQNTYEEDFIHFANLLFSRLQVRGYHWTNLKNMFKIAGEKINERYLNKYKNLNAKRTNVKKEQNYFYIQPTTPNIYPEKGYKKLLRNIALLQTEKATV